MADLYLYNFVEVCVLENIYEAVTVINNENLESLSSIIMEEKENSTLVIDISLMNSNYLLKVQNILKVFRYFDKKVIVISSKNKNPKIAKLSQQTLSRREFFSKNNLSENRECDLQAPDENDMKAKAIFNLFSGKQSIL